MLAPADRRRRARVRGADTAGGPMTALAEPVHPPVRTGAPVLSVKDLVVRYGPVTAVDGVSFDIAPGETLGVVGESGCGKSTLARAVLALQPAAAGSVGFGGTELTTLDAPARRRIARAAGRVPGPARVAGPAHAHRRHGHRGAAHPRARRPSRARDRAKELLGEVGLDAALARRRPGQLSGGQLQRIAIARALATRPRMVVLDEPVSALDVSVQAQVVNLLQDLQDKHRIGYLFIAHTSRSSGTSATGWPSCTWARSSSTRRRTTCSPSPSTRTRRR
ncbi:hypothetical protein BJF78_30340 [Pseudonocardia sp. CNS-139]|nr:hypothetical protein BJF78_30340 [Pseudonocardia sp. CNS-139]